MRRHIAVVHNIEPNYHNGGGGGRTTTTGLSRGEVGDNRALLSVVHKTTPPPTSIHRNTNKPAVAMPLHNKDVARRFSPIRKGSDSSSIVGVDNNNPMSYQMESMEYLSTNCSSPISNNTAAVKSHIFKHTANDTTKSIAFKHNNNDNSAMNTAKSTIYKHTCGICQLRFRKKQVMKI